MYLRTIEDKVRSKNLLVNNQTSDSVMDMLFNMSDELVVTFLQCSMSTLVGRIMIRDDIDLEDYSQFEIHHRKLLALVLDSLDGNE